MNKNRKLIWGSFLIYLIFIICIGPIDIFFHGFFGETVAYDQINSEDFKEYVNLEKTTFEQTFMPLKRHFAGSQINLVNLSDDNKGELLLEIFNNKGKLIEAIHADISKVRAGEWYKVYSKKKLKPNQIYTLRITAKECQSVPYLQIVDDDYLGKENISGNLLLGYAYALSTFSLPEKILIILFLGSMWLWFVSRIVEKKKLSDRYQHISLFILLLSVLTWNYMFNSMDNENASFNDFQTDSETLVTGVIKAEHEGVDLSSYGLGRYIDTLGELNNYHSEFQTDSTWDKGYSKEKPQILIAENDYTIKYAMVGNYIQFANNDVLRIKNVESSENKLIVTLDINHSLSESKYGSLSQIRFTKSHLEDGLEQPGILEPYLSQYGLQGKIFRHLSRYVTFENSIVYFHFLCCILTAATFTVIVFLLRTKYNMLLACCFYVTFWLSPWIVNYAKNLYWVEFTWFIPMLVGLYCFHRIDSVRSRYLCYILIWVSITVKCLCGYEYLSTIMLAMIAFPLADLFNSMIKKDKKSSILMFKTIFIIGMVAVIGFVTAICIHAGLRGDNLSEGIRNIFEQDVLRRTSGGDLNNFSEVYWSSFNASVWEVLKKYFHFSTNIIVGVSGALFPILCIVPLIIFGNNIYRKTVNWTDICMYSIFLLTSISWFILAKSHSFIHTGLNFVMWYFGFIQICFYVIIKWIIMQIRNKKSFYG